MTGLNPIQQVIEVLVIQSRFFWLRSHSEGYPVSDFYNKAKSREIVSPGSVYLSKACLLVVFTDEVLDLRDPALEDQIAVIRLSGGDIPRYRGQHQITHFLAIRSLSQSPAQLDIGDFRE